MERFAAAGRRHDRAPAHGQGLHRHPAAARATDAGTPTACQDIQYITRIVRFASIAIENASLFRQATTDRMTGLFSHHFFEKTLDEELERARRYKSTFSLVMFDIDHFKKFNDAYGHLQGDRIIREIARQLTASPSARWISPRATAGRSSPSSSRRWTSRAPWSWRRGSAREWRPSRFPAQRRRPAAACHHFGRVSPSSIPSPRMPPRRSSARRTGPSTSPRRRAGTG